MTNLTHESPFLLDPPPTLESQITFARANTVVKNRAVLAPLTHNMSSVKGNISANEVGWLSKCAEGGFGMVISAATQVRGGGKCWPGQPALITEHQKLQFITLADTIKGSGALFIVQLHHGGIRSAPNLNIFPPSGPSYIAPNKRYKNGVRRLDSQEINRIINAFVRSAVLAYEAGVDGVEIHAAHNFLLCNFLNPSINRRKDEWGGSLLNRTRVIREIIERIRRKVSRRFVIGVRLSPESYSNVEGIELENQLGAASLLSESDIDYLHFSMIDAFKTPNSGGGDASLVEVVKEGSTISVPIIAAGAISNGDDAHRALKLGADMVAVGTAAVGNPDWYKKVVNGQQLIKPPYKQALLKGNYFTDQSLEYFRGISGLLETSRG